MSYEDRSLLGTVVGIQENLKQLKFAVKVAEGPYGWKKLTWSLNLFGEDFEVNGMIPPGFPAAHPDLCYFAKGTLDRLYKLGPRSLLTHSAAMGVHHPKPAPYFPECYLCVPIHLQAWNPNRDSAVTYIRALNRSLIAMQEDRGHE